MHETLSLCNLLTHLNVTTKNYQSVHLNVLNNSLGKSNAKKLAPKSARGQEEKIGRFALLSAQGTESKAR